jgi:hypothetical protein
MLEKKKLLMRQNVVDNSQKIKDKMCDILDRMEKYKRFGVNKSTSMTINEAYIEKKINLLGSTMNGVFDDYVKVMIIQIVKVTANC